MKLNEMVLNQNIIIQLVWGEQKIEFDSEVLINDSTGVYISPYLHNGSVLELNISPGRGVVCNLFTNNPITKQRISWKGIEMQTVDKDGKKLYMIKTSGYNGVAEGDDRRTHDRVIVNLNGKVDEIETQTITDIIIHDISDIGISFYAPVSFAPKSYQLVVYFEDIVDGKNFDIKLECTITRIEKRIGNVFVGCKIVGENKNYLIYGFVMRLREKNKQKNITFANVEVVSESVPEEDKQQKLNEAEVITEDKEEEKPNNG